MLLLDISVDILPSVIVPFANVNMVLCYKQQTKAGLWSTMACIDLEKDEIACGPNELLIHAGSFHSFIMTGQTD